MAMANIIGARLSTFFICKGGIEREFDCTMQYVMLAGFKMSQDSRLQSMGNVQNSRTSRKRG